MLQLRKKKTPKTILSEFPLMSWNVLPACLAGPSVWNKLVTTPPPLPPRPNRTGTTQPGTREGLLKGGSDGNHPFSYRKRRLLG